MANWFATKREANKELLKRQKPTDIPTEFVFKWRFTKRKKPFFVGTEFSWLNV